MATSQLLSTEETPEMVAEETESVVESVTTREEAEKILNRVPAEKSFYFYLDLGQPTGVWASSLQEFCDLIGTVDVRAVEFHTFRGDFENWFRETLNDSYMAEQIARARGLGIKGEALREQISKVAKDHYEQLSEIIETPPIVIPSPPEPPPQPTEVMEERKTQTASEEPSLPESPMEQTVPTQVEGSAEQSSFIPEEEQTVKATLEEAPQETSTLSMEATSPKLPIETATSEPPEAISIHAPEVESQPAVSITLSRPAHCHKCGIQVDSAKKQWTLESRVTQKKFLIYLYKCPACGATFREATKA